MSVSIPAAFKLTNPYGRHIATLREPVSAMQTLKPEWVQLADGSFPRPGEPLPNEVVTAIQRELTRRRIDAAKARR